MSIQSKCANLAEEKQNQRTLSDNLREEPWFPVNFPIFPLTNPWKDLEKRTAHVVRQARGGR